METVRSTAAKALARTNNHRLLYATAATAFAALAAYSRHCYLAWHALGEGGVPHSPRGWLMNVLAHLVARWDHRAVPAPYERVVAAASAPSSSSSSSSSSSPSSSTSSSSSTTKTKSKKTKDKNSKEKDKKSASSSKDVETTVITLSARDEERYGAFSRTSFFSAASSSSSSSSTAAAPALPSRAPPRPTVPTTVLPQRQTTETASAATLAAQGAYLRGLAAANPRLFAVRPSALESPKFPALWVIPSSPSPSSSSTSSKKSSREKGGAEVDPESVPWFPASARGETAHVHPEGSTHAVLSLADAAHVVRQGWGERHKMSGVGRLLPWGYVLVYAPREGRREDWMVWREIVLAAARACAKAAGFEGEVVVPH
ncbi:hypothetical protein F4825DRAFT_382293 [Nemania diffusa]|nr:hypothetical protein F4825DRAFT_382293 [Nemania diffusa]